MNHYQTRPILSRQKVGVWPELTSCRTIDQPPPAFVSQPPQTPTMSINRHKRQQRPSTVTWSQLSTNRRRLVGRHPMIVDRRRLLATQAYRGGEILVWENFCPEKFRRGKIPPQSLKVMGKIAPPFSMVKGKA